MHFKGIPSDERSGHANASITRDDARKIMEEGREACYEYQSTLYCTKIVSTLDPSRARLTSGWSFPYDRLLDPKGRKKKEYGEPRKVDLSKVMEKLPRHSEEIRGMSFPLFMKLLKTQEGTDTVKNYNELARSCLNDWRGTNDSCTPIATRLDHRLSSLSDLVLKRIGNIPYTSDNPFQSNFHFPASIDDHQSAFFDASRKATNKYPASKFGSIDWRHVLVNKWIVNKRKVSQDDEKLHPRVDGFAREKLNEEIRGIILPFIKSADDVVMDVVTNRTEIPEEMMDPIFDAAWKMKEERSPSYNKIKNNMLESDNSIFWDRFALSLKGDEAKRGLRNIMTKKFDPTRRKEILDIFMKENKKKFIISAYDMWGSYSNCDALEKLSYDKKEEIANSAWRLIKEKCPARYLQLAHDDIVKSRGKVKAQEVIEEIITLFSFVGYHKKEVDQLVIDIATDGSLNAKEGLIEAMDPSNLYKNCDALEILSKDGTIPKDFLTKVKRLRLESECIPSVPTMSGPGKNLGK